VKGCACSTWESLAPGGN